MKNRRAMQIRAERQRWAATLPDIHPGDYVAVCVNRRFAGVGRVERCTGRHRLYLVDSGREPFTAPSRKLDWGSYSGHRYTTWYRVSREKAMRRARA